MASTFISLSALILCVLWVVRKLRSIGSRDAFLPPGPPTIPILGNLLILPQERPWYKFTEWSRTYGEIYSLKVGWNTTIVISSVEAFKEIMEKNSALVSDRPKSALMDEVVGENNVAFAHYSNGWRALRKCAREILTFQACQQHLEIQRAEAIQLLFDFLTRPESWYTSTRRYSASVIFSVLFGKRAPQSSTKEVTEFFEAQHTWELLIEPGAVPPLDMIPILQYIPERFARWKTLANTAKRLQYALYSRLFNEVKAKVENGQTNGCWMETVVERGPALGLDEDKMAYLGGVLIEGASDTTSAFIQTVILALVNFPEQQRVAQEEIDRVIGPNRTPSVTDIDDLPYVQALIKEVIRWRAIAPLALPHCSIEEIRYKGYVIPKGTTIYVNNWAIFSDPNTFEDPEKFDPSRWLKPELSKNKLFDLIFGSARRVCPGQHLARNSINLNTMNLLWAFNLTPCKDPTTGQPKVYDTHDFARGLFTAPNRFDCSITPRSDHHAMIIKRDFLDAIRVFEPFEHNLDAGDKIFVQEQRESVRSTME